MKAFVKAQTADTSLTAIFERDIVPPTVAQAGKIMAQLAQDVGHKLGSQWTILEAWTA